MRLGSLSHLAEKLGLLQPSRGSGVPVQGCGLSQAPRPAPGRIQDSRALSAPCCGLSGGASPSQGVSPLPGAQTTESPLPTHRGRLETEPHGLWTGATYLSQQPEVPADLGASLSAGAGDGEWKTAPPPMGAAAALGGGLPLPCRSEHVFLSSRGGGRGSGRKATHFKSSKLEASPQPCWLTKAAGQTTIGQSGRPPAREGLCKDREKGSGRHRRRMRGEGARGRRAGERRSSQAEPQAPSPLGCIWQKPPACSSLQSPLNPWRSPGRAGAGGVARGWLEA